MTRKVLVSFEEGLLRRVDSAARERGLTRSRFLSQLAARELGAPTRTPEEQRTIGEAAVRLRELFERNPTGDEPADVTIRRMRDERTDYLARRENE